ncbi:11068_t:CDS:10 [Cetraspora pellucida]|uniref:11068_t:CDS:1 n=1 Tax=Cetraspora pellucida TaxID=1433469 RepID=A0ACA9L7K3_9GLOM|nr:11068_t:CDS:10 [Cetraspora pellucida]
MSETPQTSTSKEEQIEISVPEEIPSESSESQKNFYRTLQSLISRVKSSREKPKQIINIADDEWVHHEIIIIKIEEHRELHLLNEEDQILFEQMKAWVDDHPEEGLFECVEEFVTNPLGDALAKVLYDYQYPDFIITYCNDLKDRHQHKKELKRRNFERLLLKSGLIVEHEGDAASENVYVKLYAPFGKLCEQAEVIKLRMKLDTKTNMKELKELEELIPQLKPHIAAIMRYFTHPINFKKQSAIFKIEKLRQFEGAEKSKSIGDIILDFFPMSRRNLMVYRIIVTANQIQKTVLFEGNQILAKRQIKSLSVDSLINQNVFLNYFPLHDGPYEHDQTVRVEELVEQSFYGEPIYKTSDDDREPILESVSDKNDGKKPASDRKRKLKLNKRAWLYENWVKSIGRQPLEEIKEYFGEKMALYFAWLGFYTTWLTISSAAGVLVIVNGTIEGIKTQAFFGGAAGISVIWDNALTAPFAFFMSIWSILFLQYWKRTNASIQYDWNVTEFEREELPRPEFYGTTLRKSPITMKNEIHFPFSQRLQKLAISGIVVFVSYASEIVKEINIGCDYGNCMIELTIQLAIILIGRQLFGQCQEILIPWAMGKLNKRELLNEIEALKAKYEHSGKKNTNIPQWVNDDRLSCASGTIIEYEEMVIQFGFIALFGPAFPLAPLFAWLNNITEIRSDAFKYLVELQRPVGFLAQDIGMWEYILNIIALMAVLSNATIIAFHSTWMKKQFQQYIDDPDDENQLLVVRLAFIMIFEHLFFLIQLFLAYIIPDVPRTVRIAAEREKYLTKLTLEDTSPALDEFLSTDDKNQDLFDESGELKLPKYTIDEGMITRSRTGFKSGIEGIGRSIKSGIDVVTSGAGKAVGEIAEGVVSDVGVAVSSVMGTTDDSEKEKQEKQ